MFLSQFPLFLLPLCHLLKCFPTDSWHHQVLPEGQNPVLLSNPLSPLHLLLSFPFLMLWLLFHRRPRRCSVQLSSVAPSSGIPQSQSLWTFLHPFPLMFNLFLMMHISPTLVWRYWNGCLLTSGGEFSAITQPASIVPCMAFIQVALFAPIHFSVPPARATMPQARSSAPLRVFFVYSSSIYS